MNEQNFLETGNLIEQNLIKVFDYVEFIGKKVRKISGKPFKNKEKETVPIELVKSTFSGKLAFIFEDGSVVDCFRCELV